MLNKKTDESITGNIKLIFKVKEWGLGLVTVVKVSRTPVSKSWQNALNWLLPANI